MRAPLIRLRHLLPRGGGEGYWGAEALYVHHIRERLPRLRVALRLLAAARAIAIGRGAVEDHEWLVDLDFRDQPLRLLDNPRLRQHHGDERRALGIEQQLATARGLRGELLDERIHRVADRTARELAHEVAMLFLHRVERFAELAGMFGRRQH